MADFIDINATGGVTQAQVQAACEAAIAAANLPSAAEVATAVNAQAACAAAITAANLPTATQVAATVASDPSLATMIDGRLDVKLPDLLSTSAEIATGTGSVVVAAGPGQRVEIFGFELNTVTFARIFANFFSGSDSGTNLANYAGVAYGPGPESITAPPISWNGNVTPRFTTDIGEGFFVNNDSGTTLNVYVTYRIV